MWISIGFGRRNKTALENSLQQTAPFFSHCNPICNRWLWVNRNINTNFSSVNILRQRGWIQVITNGMDVFLTDSVVSRLELNENIWNIFNLQSEDKLAPLHRRWWRLPRHWKFIVRIENLSFGLDLSANILHMNDRMYVRESFQEKWSWIHCLWV